MALDPYARLAEAEIVIAQLKADNARLLAEIARLKALPACTHECSSFAPEARAA
jgi:hypothetical protein